MCWRSIKLIFLVHTFNVKKISCLVNYMIIISNIHNRMPKSGILFTDISIGDFFNGIDFMKHWVEAVFYYYYLWAKIEPKRRYEWFRAKRSDGTERVLADCRDALSACVIVDSA